MRRTFCAVLLLANSLILLLDSRAVAADHIRRLQEKAEASGRAAWGHWGTKPERYSTWSWHSNRLIPVYTFGISLEAFKGANSIYRDADRLRALYGEVPKNTLNPKAQYFDQTDIYRLQKQAVAQGKKYIFLIVLDGMDWTTTQAAATWYSGRVAYKSGRGSGLHFQNFRRAETDYGFFVSSPHSAKAKYNVDWQTADPLGPVEGGYDPRLGGATPWAARVDLDYLIGKNRRQPHAVTDSAAAATALCSGVKTYNDAINIDTHGKQVEPIARQLQAQGFAVGAVTSVPISHATPACTYANNVSRSDYQDIARDQLGRVSVAHKKTPLPGLDVLLGAGWGIEAAEDSFQGQNFLPGNKYIAASTLKAIDATHGGRYRVVQRTFGAEGSALLAAAAREAREKNLRLFGMFGTSDGNLPYRTADGNYDPYVAPAKFASTGAKRRSRYTPGDLHENPTLAEMTRAALDVLEERQRFWLLIEAGDVDWAMHANSLDQAIGAIKSGDDAFRTVVRWIEDRDAWKDSAVIVTADHGHLLVVHKLSVLITPTAAK